MRKLLISLLFIFVSFSAFLAIRTSRKIGAAARAPHEIVQYKTDELNLLTAACGQPSSDKQTDASAYGGSNAVMRVLIYKKQNAEFQFLKNSVDALAWTMVGAFKAHGDDNVLSPEELHRWMPCTQQVEFHTSAWTEATSSAAPDQP